MKQDKIYVRRTQDCDQNELIKLYNQYFKPLRTVSQWRWEFRETPVGDTIHFVICTKNKIIGQMILIPLFMKYKDRKVLSGRTQALVVEKSYRFIVAKKRLVDKLIEAVINEAKLRNIEIIWGFPLQTAIKAFEKNGFVTQEVEAFGCNLTMSALIAKVQAKLRSYTKLSFLIIPSFFAKIPSVKSIMICISNIKRQKCSLYPAKNENHIEKVWKLVEEADELALDRSSQFIRWRYLENPFFINEILIIEEGGKDCGFVVLGDRIDDQIKKGFIVDFCMDLSKGKLVDRVFDLVLRHFYKNGVDQVVIWNKRHDDTFFKNILIRNGLRKRGTAANFNFLETGHDPITQTLTPDNIWALSMAYMEGPVFNQLYCGRK